MPQRGETMQEEQLAGNVQRAVQFPDIRTIAEDAPWTWLQKGWQDLTTTPTVSLAYGAGIVAAGWLLSGLFWWTDWTYLVMPLAGGFMLVAPLVAVGLYDTSRRCCPRRATATPRTAPTRRSRSK
jgi:uncharacterized membrane protein